MGTQPRTGFERVPPRRHEDRNPPTREAATVPSPPTDEQLANCAVVLGFPILATPIFMKMAHWREGMLNLHALMVRMLNGDDEAARTIAKLGAAFGTNRDLYEVADDLKTIGENHAE